MKNYTNLKNQKALIEKHISYLKQQYLSGVIDDVEWNHEMAEANAALKKVNKLINS
jgi:hypothetical protein